MRGAAIVGGGEEVRLAGPAGPLAPQGPGRRRWDRLPEGRYTLAVDGRALREAYVGAGAEVDLGAVEAAPR